MIEAVEPLDQAARFDVAATLVEHHYAVAETRTTSMASAIDAARRLRSGERLLRIAMRRAWMNPAIGLCEEALQRLDVKAAPIRALAFATMAWIKMWRAIPDFIDDLDTATALLADLDPSAPGSARPSVGRARSPAWGSPARPPGSACATKPSRSPPMPRIRGGIGSRAASTSRSPGSSTCAEATCCWPIGRRADFEANLTFVEEIGGGNWEPRAACGLATLVSRCWTTSTGASATCPPAPPGWSKRTLSTTPMRLPLVARAAIEEGRVDDVLAAIRRGPRDRPRQVLDLRDRGSGPSGGR